MGFLPFLSKNLNFSNISLEGYTGMVGGILTISACLSLEKPNFNNFLDLRSKLVCDSTSKKIVILIRMNNLPVCFIYGRDKVVSNITKSFKFLDPIDHTSIDLSRPDKISHV